MRGTAFGANIRIYRFFRDRTGFILSDGRCGADCRSVAFRVDNVAGKRREIAQFQAVIRIFGVQLRNPAMRKFYFLFMLLPALSWSVALRAQRLGIEVTPACPTVFQEFEVAYTAFDDRVVDRAAALGRSDAGPRIGTVARLAAVGRERRSDRLRTLLLPLPGPFARERRGLRAGNDSRRRRSRMPF